MNSAIGNSTQKFYSKLKRNEILRILDVNFNRSREGLRVCEEITRFVMEDAALTKELKKVRHAISRSLKNFSVSAFELVAARDTRRDVGKGSSRLEKARQSTVDIFLANSERVKESLRVLEETSKLLNQNTSCELKKIRFCTYALEKKVLKKLETLCHH